MLFIKQSSTAYPLVFYMVQSADHTSPATGLSPSVQLSKAGGAFAVCAGAVSEIGLGWYKVAGNATDTNTLGSLVLHATGSSADVVDLMYNVVAFDPQASSNLGLSNLDTTVSSRFPTSSAPINFSSTSIDSSGRVLLQPSQPGVTIPTVTSVTNGVSLASADSRIFLSGTCPATGTSTTAVLPSLAIQVDNIYKGCQIKVYAGTGSGQVNVITSYTGLSQTATVGIPWRVNLDTTSQIVVLAQLSPLLDSNLYVTANNSSIAVSGNVTVGGYASGQDPLSLLTTDSTKWAGAKIANLDVAVSSRMATFTLPTNFSSLAIDGSGQVTLGSWRGSIPNFLISGRVDSNAQVVGDKTGYALTTAEHTSISGTDVPTGLTTQGYTTLRAGYLDRLNIIGQVASQGDVQLIQNNTSIVRSLPTVVELPVSGTFSFPIYIYLYDTNSASGMVDPDSAPTISVADGLGNTRNYNLDSTTMTKIATGKYKSIYTIPSTGIAEDLYFEFTAVVAGVTRIYGNVSQVVNNIAVDFTYNDRTILNDIFNNLGIPSNVSVANDVANVKTELDTVNTNVSSIKTKTDQLAFSSGWVQAIVESNLDKTGYSLSQAFPTNFATFAIDTSGRVNLQPNQNYNNLGVVATVGTVTGSVGSVTNVLTVNLSSNALTAISTGLMNYQTEAGWTLVSTLRIMLSALAGLTTTTGETQIVFKDINNTKNRITCTLNANGDRNLIVYDGS